MFFAWIVGAPVIPGVSFGDSAFEKNDRLITEVEKLGPAIAARRPHGWENR